MLHTVRELQFKKNTQTALMLVVFVSIGVWFIFNLFVDAYPPRPASYQTTPTPTPAVAEPLDYHYDNTDF